MDTNNEVLEILKSVGAIITNSHIVLTSGRHSDGYINKDALYPHTQQTSQICELFAQKHKDLKIDVVAAPSLGGIVLETWTAHHLSKLQGKEILGVYTEKTPEKDQIFTRGYDTLVSGKNVLILEDLTATGGSVKKVVASVKQIGGNVVAVCVMVNRDPKNITSASIGVPFSSLATLELASYEQEDCPLCKNGVPINTTVGHGKKYLAEKAKM